MKFLLKITTLVFLLMTTINSHALFLPVGQGASSASISVDEEEVATPQNQAVVAIKKFLLLGDFDSALECIQKQRKTISSTDATSIKSLVEELITMTRYKVLYKDQQWRIALRDLPASALFKILSSGLATGSFAAAVTGLGTFSLEMLFGSDEEDENSDDEDAPEGDLSDEEPEESEDGEKKPAPTPPNPEWILFKNSVRSSLSTAKNWGLSGTSFGLCTGLIFSGGFFLASGVLARLLFLTKRVDQVSSDKIKSLQEILTYFS